MRHLPSISPLSSVYLTFDRVFFFISSPAFPPITGADDPNGFAAIGKANGQNAALGATNAQQPWFLAAVGRVDLNQLLRVVERGCRFGEIDAVLRDVRCFFLGIPFKSHYPLDTGTIWDNVNIELQYNFVGNRPTATAFTICTDLGPAGFERCNALTLQRFDGSRF